MIFYPNSIVPVFSSTTNILQTPTVINKTTIDTSKKFFIICDNSLTFFALL